tara:strand:- start:131 stop:505 length:375 start_codon:yes stop_codon:yes gene_type:complete
MTDDWATPKWLKGLFEDWYDPCPLNAHFDGLLIPEWDSVYKEHEPNGIYINPPYSNPLPWVLKAIETNHKYGTKIVMLLKHDSSTQWYAALKEAGARFLMIEGRLKFGNSRSGAPFPSVLVVLS